LTGGGRIRSAGGWRAVKEAYRHGVRLAGDERTPGSSDFVETTFKEAGEAYDRRMKLESAGMDLSAVVAATCGNLDIHEKELASHTKSLKVARARAVVSHIATWVLRISGSDLARRLNVDRSAVSRAAQRVENDPELMATVGTIPGQLGLEKKSTLKQRPLNRR